VASPAADLSRLHVLVPVRGLADGKARLGMALDAEERETLIVGLLVATLRVVGEWRPASAVHVISADHSLLALARRHGARAIEDAATADLNRALRLGRESAAAASATAVLCLPADLPVLSAPALDRLLDAADAALAAGHGQPIVVAAPADARDGTNALLLSPVDVIDPAFGESSLTAHVAAAARADATVQLVVDPELGFDLDTPEDLERVESVRLLDLTAIGASALAQIEGAAEPIRAADAR
jgi:2-phospho-L-lactate guanylyltransferase